MLKIFQGELSIVTKFHFLYLNNISKCISIVNSDSKVITKSPLLLIISWRFFKLHDLHFTITPNLQHIHSKIDYSWIKTLGGSKWLEAQNGDLKVMEWNEGRYLVHTLAIAAG